jgi:hypothetical protein
MSDVEQARLLARPVVRVDDAQVAVLHRHRIAAKWHKLGAMLAVQLIQARLAQLLFWRLCRGISGVLLLWSRVLAGCRRLTRGSPRRIPRDMSFFCPQSGEQKPLERWAQYH